MLKKIVKHTLLIILVLIMLFPVFFIIVGSTNDSGWVFEEKFNLTFGNTFVDNYLSINNETFNVWQSLLISFSTSLITSIISLIVLFLASYALSKYSMRYKNLIWGLFMTLSLIPQPSFLVGQLDVIQQMKMYSTYIGLILPFIINLRVMIYMKQACSYIPDSLLDAGRMEGAGEFTVMLRIAIPKVKDKLAMSAFLLFVSSWNNFLIPMLITSDSKLFNLPTFISALADPLRYNIGAVFMSLLFSIIPIMIMFLILSPILYKKEN